MERKIGEAFSYQGKTYIVAREEEGGVVCGGCCRYNVGSCASSGFMSASGHCAASFRNDDKGVIFKEVKEPKMKYIKLGKPYIEDRSIKVVIEEQSHIRLEFGSVGVHFESSAGLTLCSMSSPENALGDHRNKVYVRGDTIFNDHVPLAFETLEGYLRFEDAVREYNEYFSKPQIKEVTMEELHKLLGYEVKIKE